MAPAFIALAFFLGSIPTGLLLARAKGIDIRAAGSGNIGATNVGRILGRRLGLLCLVFDLLKGFAPTLGFGLASGFAGRITLEAREALLYLAVAIAAILGHVFSPWLRFRGGKGVATGLGAMLAVFPVLSIAVGVAAVVWVLAVWRWRYVSLASILAAFTIPPSVALVFSLRALAAGLPIAPALGASLPFVLGTFALAGLVVWTHRANIARLRAGNENRVNMARSGVNTPEKAAGQPPPS